MEDNTQVVENKKTEQEQVKEVEKMFTQAELEEVIAKRLAREKTKIEKAKESEMAARLKAELEESEKLAQMTEAEKAKAIAAKKELEFKTQLEKFEEERKAFEQEKILNLTMKTLGEKGLPVEFATFIKASNADDIMDNIVNFEKGFNEAVDKAVTERLRGKTPSTSARIGTVTKEEFKRMNYAERLAIYNTNKELYDQLNK